MTCNPHVTLHTYSHRFFKNQPSLFPDGGDVMRTGLLGALLACSFFCAQAYGQSATLNEVHTVAAPTVAAPAEHSFTIDSAHAGVLTVTLSDPGAALTPAAPLGAVALEITSGSSAVTLNLPGGTTGTALTTAGKASFTALAGTYVVHVVGTPGSAGTGLTDVQIADPQSAVLAEFSDTLAVPAGGLPSTLGVLNDQFTVADGTYTVTLSDMRFPQALPLVTLAIVPQGGAPIVTLSLDGTTPSANMSVALQSGVTYRVFAVGEVSDAIANGGLFGVNVAPAGGGASVYGETVSVGAVELITKQTLPATTFTLTVNDLQFPTPLQASGVGAAVTQNGISAAQQTGTGTTPAFSTNGSAYEIFGVGLPASTAGAGAYTVTLQPGTAGAAPALSVARAVVPADGSINVYSYDTTLVAEPYTLSLTDFAVPAAFTSVQAALVQGGAIVGAALTHPGPATLTAMQGPASVLVYARSSAAGGLFGLDLTAVGAGASAFSISQGVGQAFTGRKITVSQGGNYTVSVSDVAFPAAFSSLYVVVTRGVTSVGYIAGSGTLKFDATGGDYFVNFIAQPTGAMKAGTYAISVAPTPAAPTLNLTSSSPTVSSGTAATLSWTSTNATTCSASGGWSGTKPTSGPATSGLLTSDTTFTLACTGPGGSITQSVVVKIATASDSTGGGGKGGGGGLGLELLLLAATLGLNALRFGDRRFNFGGRRL